MLLTWSQTTWGTTNYGFMWENACRCPGTRVVPTTATTGRRSSQYRGERIYLDNKAQTPRPLSHQHHSHTLIRAPLINIHRDPRYSEILRLPQYPTSKISRCNAVACPICPRRRHHFCFPNLMQRTPKSAKPKS